ncbi:MAG: TVP38/TMEM64 family protein [Betaproteobacteria bacterium]|nr:TVP38/TMEM64 family protein [Betaproteobacteria bacterium]
MAVTRAARLKYLAGVLILVALAATYRLLQETGMLMTILNGAELRERVAQLGTWGPLMVIGLMVLAILVSPIPSGPVAVAAGAAYGHTWGTLYVLLGAEIGALAAFGLARLLGREVVQRWFGDRLSVGLLGSQTALMGIVLVSRLLPFISFDIVSYAAGLTALSFWRFAVATLLGIVPASFLLAHFGSEMATSESDRIMVSILALGVITLIPVAVKIIRDRMHQPPTSR